MGLSITESCRVFGPNYSQNSFFHSDVSTSRRPILGTALKWLRATKKFAKINASVRSDAVDEGVFQFKPSFDEYLKAMESVRSGREKKESLSSGNSDGENGELRDSGMKISSVSLRNGRDPDGLRSKKDGTNGELRNSVKKTSRGFMMKEGGDKNGLRNTKGYENGKIRDSRRRNVSVVVLKEGRNSDRLRTKKYVKHEELRDSPGTPSKGGRYDGVLRNQIDDENGNLSDSGGKNSMSLVMKGGRNNGDLRSPRSGKNESLRDSAGRLSGSSPMKEGRDNYGLRRVKHGDNDELRDSLGRIPNGIVSKEGKNDVFGLAVSGNEKVTHNKIIRAEKVRKFNKDFAIREDINGDEVLDMERAAFKPSKELEDIYAKARITRTEMEDRIQKLAKCLNGADINMPEWMFTKTMTNAQIRFSDHSMLRLIQILGKLGNWRRVLQVIEWIQIRERFKSHKLRYVYTAALDVFGKSRRPVEALNLFNLMLQQMSSYPDLVAYRSIAVTLGQAGHMKELFYVIETMRSPPKKKLNTGVLEKWDPRLEPDIVVYNAVLNACVHRQKWEGAFWVMQQMKQQGLQPSITTYGLAMEVMLACGKYNLVHEFFRKVQKSCIPNALTYKVLLNTFWREGKIDEAILAVQDMERRGIVGTASLYYDLARCLCSAGRCEEAILQIEKLCKVANKPLVVTYTGLMQACIDSGNVANAAFLFNHMQNFCPPNLVTYNVMLKAFLDDGKFKEGKELFLTILGDRKVMPDLYTFNVMLDAFAAERKWEDVEFAYVNMLKYGYHFNVKRHLRIILEACAAGKEELLEETWKHLARGDIVPPSVLIGARFRSKLEQGDLTEALSCFGCHPSIELQAFSRKRWLKFLKDDSHRYEKHILVKLIHATESLVTRTEAQKLILQNLRISCEELLTEMIKYDDHKSLETSARTPIQTVLVSC